MDQLQLPDKFKQSYKNLAEYPSNLLYQSSYPYALRAYTTRLNDAASRLFVRNDADIRVAVRDMVPATQGGSFDPSKLNIFNDAKLRNWLGDSLGVEPDGAIATKEDPKCRFIFILAKHSRAPLKITRKMLDRILTYHQVMPGYLDFVSVFGSQSLPRDIRFSGFREQTLLSPLTVRGPAVPSLRRSGRQYQLCFNLRAVALQPDPNGTPRRARRWSIRQAAFHHQFDVVYGTTLWIITRGGLDIKERVEELTKVSGRLEDRAFGKLEDCFRSTLSVHLLLCHWSMEEWRWYLQWLEEVVEEETQIAVIGPRDQTHARRLYESKDVQRAQDYEEKTNEAIMVLEANVDVLIALRNFYYEKLTKNPDFPDSLKNLRHDDVLHFVTQIEDMVYDAKGQISRAKLLSRVIADRKTLVMQHLQTQATEKMESLTLSMGKVGLLSQREAIIMRIITVGALIYLPATFVSTFFGTDIVKYQNDNSGTTHNGTFSKVAMIRWVQVALPLTAATLALAYLFFKIADKKRERDMGTEPHEEAVLGDKQGFLHGSSPFPCLYPDEVITRKRGGIGRLFRTCFRDSS